MRAREGTWASMQFVLRTTKSSSQQVMGWRQKEMRRLFSSHLKWKWTILGRKRSHLRGVIFATWHLFGPLGLRLCKGFGLVVFLHLVLARSAMVPLHFMLLLFLCHTFTFSHFNFHLVFTWSAVVPLHFILISPTNKPFMFTLFIFWWQKAVMVPFNLVLISPTNKSFNFMVFTHSIRNGTFHVNTFYISPTNKNCSKTIFQFQSNYLFHQQTKTMYKKV